MPCPGLAEPSGAGITISVVSTSAQKVSVTWELLETDVLGLAHSPSPREKLKW